MDEENPLRGYPVVIQLPVLWGQMDAFRHVNNVEFFRFFESARIAYGDKIEMFKALKEVKIGPILAATSCNFMKPLRYPDTLRVGCRTTKLSESEMEQEYAVFSQQWGKVAAVGTARIVAYDYGELKRTTFPDSILDRVLHLEEHLRLS